MRIPDEKDDDSTMINFVKSHIVPRARIIYNLSDEHINLLNPMLPTVIKESRIKHANTKGVDYQAFVAGGFVYMVVDGVITAVAAVSDIVGTSALGGGLVATGETGVLAGVETAAEAAGETVAETVAKTAGNAFKTAAKNTAIAAAGAGASAVASAVGKQIYKFGEKFACDSLNAFNLGQKVGCPKKHLQLKTNRTVPDSRPEQATP